MLRILFTLPFALILLSLPALAQDTSSRWDDPDANAFVDSLMQEMTLEEKIGQMTLFTSDYDVTGPTMRDNYLEDIRSGRAGAIFNAHTAEYTRQLQEIAVEETRLGIPLLFGYDVIHGHKTIFPIPLAEASSWDLEMIKESARLSAKEAAASGLHWTFNPMVDIARDARWGRIAEGSGEDPYLSSLIARAKVKGYQGEDWSDPLTVLACVKHFAAYGASQAGRDYHTVDMSELRLRETYLPPYKAAIDAGAASVMTAFNELFGVPATGSRFLLNDILREEWNYPGFVVTDYTSINEMVPHGVAASDAEAGILAVKAGVDMDMQGAVFYNHLADAVAEGQVSEDRINEAVRRILLAKYFLGLFEDPYRYSNKEREAEVVLSDELMQHALDAGRKSIVLLKNDTVNGSSLLPLSDDVNSIALIGPLADNQLDLLGTWHASGDESRVVTLLQALREAMPNTEIRYAEGAGFTGSDTSGFAAARQIAIEADLIIMAVGENYQQSGEAASRSDLNLPGPQEALMREMQQTGKPMVAVVMAGRPLTISWMDENVPAIVYAWHLGTMAGQAISDVLSGEYNPSAKLPVTFPRSVGQIPIYYNMKQTGRPYAAENKYTSKYLDISNEPLYPFGYGLTYTEFTYSAPTLSSESMSMDDSIMVSVTVSNTGDRAGQEIVQMYVRDLVGSVTRPVKELKAFEKISLEPGEEKKVRFSIDADDLAFYNQALEYGAEPGNFQVMVGPSSSELQILVFSLTE
jgi:beta-glucosidase